MTDSLRYVCRSCGAVRFFDGQSSVLCARLAAAQGWRVHAVYNARNKHQQDEFTCGECYTKQTKVHQTLANSGSGVSIEGDRR